MTDNEIIKALKCCKKAKINQDCVVLKCPFSTEYGCNIGLENLRNEALDLINRQKAEIERLKKNYEELIYKTECLLCHATGNKFSKYTYTTQEMISFVDDYIQDCCDEVIEETKATAKSEAIKEFTKKVDELLERYSAIHNNAEIAMQDEIECDNETIEMQSVWDVHTLIKNEMSEYEEMYRLQDNIENIAKEQLLKEIEKDFRLLVKEMTELETNQRKEDESND